MDRPANSHKELCFLLRATFLHDVGGTVKHCVGQNQARSNFAVMVWNLLLCVDLVFGMLLHITRNYWLFVSIQSGSGRRLGLDRATGCTGPHQFSVKFMPFLIIGFYTRWPCSIMPEVRHNGVTWRIWRFKGKSKVKYMSVSKSTLELKCLFHCDVQFLCLGTMDRLSNAWAIIFINTVYLVARLTIDEDCKKTCIFKGEKYCAEMLTYRQDAIGQAGASGGRWMMTESAIIQTEALCPPHPVSFISLTIAKCASGKIVKE